MFLSFKPEVFQRIQAGKKKVELRRSFPDDVVKAYMYVSSPVCAIKGIVFLGKRKALVELEQEYSRKKGYSICNMWVYGKSNLCDAY